MANLEYAIIRDVVNTATGNQTFSSGDSWTPKAVLFYQSFATADATNTNHMVGGFGIAESTTKRGACAFTSEHGQGTSDSARGGSLTDCIVISESNPTSAPNGLADFVSSGAGQVTVNWSKAPSAAFKITVVLLGGTDLSVHYENVAVSATQDVATTVTCGFPIDVALVGYFDDPMDGTIDSVWARSSFGAAVWNGSTFDQRCNYSESEDQRVTAEVNNLYSETYAGYSIGGNEGIDIDNRTSTTFDVSPRLSGSGENCMVLALGLGGGSAKIGTYATRTTTGTDTVTTTFEPGFVMLGMSNISNIDTSNTDVDSTYGIAVFDNGGTVSSSDQWADEDGPTTTNSQSRTNTGVELVDFDGTANYTATPNTTSSAFTLNFSAVNGSTDNWWYLALEKGVAVGGATGKSNPMSGPLGGPLAGVL